MEYLLPASWQGVSVYRDLHICSQHFDTKDIVKTLYRITKVVNGAFPAIFNPQEVRVNEKNNIGKRKKKFKRWKRSEVSSEKSPCVIWCRFEGSRLFFRVRTTKSVLRQLKKIINKGKKVWFCFLLNGHWSTRSGRAFTNVAARLKIENKVLRNKVISAAFLQSFIVVPPFSFPFHTQLLKCMSLAFRKFCSSGHTYERRTFIVCHLQEYSPEPRLDSLK